jgi:hypothetical protein
MTYILWWIALGILASGTVLIHDWYKLNLKNYENTEEVLFVFFLLSCAGPIAWACLAYWVLYVRDKKS